MKNYRFYCTAAISILMAILLQIFDPPIVSELMESKTYDLRLRLREKLHDHIARPDILIVAIDEQSLKEVGRWPWSRDMMARLVDRISAGRPKVIGIDIMFSEHESVERDNALRAAIQKAGNVVLATAFVAGKRGFAPPAAIDIPDFLWESAFMEVRSVEGIEGKKWAIRAEKALPPIRELAEVAVLGHVTIHPDLDGVLRWEVLGVAFGDEMYPSLPLQLARIGSGLKMQDLALYSGASIKFGGRIIKTDLSGRVLVNYIGREGSFTTLSAGDVISGRIPASRFRDAIILVGTTALATYDQKVTPFSADSPGVEKNATVVQNLLENDFITKSPGVIEVAIIILTGIFLALILPRLSAVAGVSFGFLLVAAYTLTACWFLVYRDYWLGMMLPIGNMVVILSAETIAKLFFEERRAKEIRKMFSSYVSPKIVEALINNPDMAKPGGQRKTITIMFSDIIGFTTLSENLPPEEVVSLLNEYYEVMAEIIFRWDGTLDKFVGDEIMAVWGSPLDQSDHAELALRCALNMSDRLDQLREDWRQRGLALIDCGIGLNTGEALIGNIGLAGKKMDYTAIGNHVNIAARVEKLTRQYDSRILITDNTCHAVRHLLDAGSFGHIELIEREAVKVKGKEELVTIISVRSLKEGEPAGDAPSAAKGA